MERVTISRPAIGLLYMQVCVVEDATDEEILEVCNLRNPSGTELGWCSVKREGEHGPVQCADHEGRIHILVGC
jgi:hypothetical protein